MGDIPVHNDSLRKAAVELVVSGECLGDCGTHPVSHLGEVAVEVGHGDELGECTIDAGDHGTNGLVLVKAVMVDIVSMKKLKFTSKSNHENYWMIEG